MFAVLERTVDSDEGLRRPIRVACNGHVWTLQWKGILLRIRGAHGRLQLHAHLAPIGYYHEPEILHDTPRLTGCYHESET